MTATGKSAPLDPERLRRARINAGLMGTELAHALGISPQRLSALENGREGASVRTVRQLAEALSVKVTDLLRSE